MGLVGKLRAWALGGLAAIAAGLLLMVRWQASRIERADQRIRDQNSWIDATKRIQDAPKAGDAKEARKWLEDYSG